MKKLATFLALAAASLLAPAAWTRDTSSSITITARVDSFAEWADASPVVLETDWAPLNKVHQSRTIAKDIVLYTNTNTTITTKPGLNNGVLTNTSLNTQTLATAYKITGSVTSPDASFKPAGNASGEFFNSQNVYHVAHEPGTGSYTLTLTTQATSPASSAPDEGLYTCSIVLTAEW